MRMFLLFAAATSLLLTSGACTPAKPTEGSAKSHLDSLVNEYFNTFNKHDAAALGLFYADSCDMKDPSMGTTMNRMARADIAKKYAEMFGYFSVIKDSVIAIYPSTNNCTVEFISIGRLPDSTKLFLPICTIFEFSNSKIIKDYTYYNNAND